MARILLTVSVALLALWPAVPGGAQTVQRIAAIVNEDVISVYDLNTRMGLVIASAQLQDTPQTRRRIAPQVLKTLVDERLQLQEAKRRKVKVGKRDIERALSQIERENKLPPGGLEKYLVERSVPMHTLMDQLRANVAWAKLVRRRLRPRVTVSTEEVDEFINRLKSRQGQLEFRLAEIVLPVESPRETPQIMQAAQRLVEQIRGGAPFDAVARQFSRSATAAVGGDLGWLHESELDDMLRRIVPEMNRGDVTNPISTINGIRIVTMSAKRRVAGADPAKVRLTLAQLFLPAQQGGAPSQMDGLVQLAEQRRPELTSCPELARVVKEVGSPRPPELGEFTAAELSPTILRAVRDLKIGEPSAPLRTPEGVMVLMVCVRNSPDVKMPDPTQVRSMLSQRRLGMLSRRYLRDLRQASVVDLRV